jgi:hypothetical protein
MKMNGRKRKHDDTEKILGHEFDFVITNNGKVDTNGIMNKSIVIPLCITSKPDRKPRGRPKATVSSSGNGGDPVHKKAKKSGQAIKNAAPKRRSKALSNVKLLTSPVEVDIRVQEMEVQSACASEPAVDERERGGGRSKKTKPVKNPYSKAQKGPKKATRSAGKGVRENVIGKQKDLEELYELESERLR